MINVSQTIKNSCKADKNTHREYIIINNQIIDIKGKLNATAYKDTTFFGTFNMKVLEFETSNDTQFRNRQFEYYKVIDGNAFKIGTFITTEVVDNDSKETIKVTANDYGLKFAVPYTTSLDYTSGTITLFQVLQECCSQVGITLRNQSITNGDFIVDSNQFVNNELVGDVVSAIAGISGNFATIDENDKLYLLFANNTGNLITKDIEETSEITNFNELNDSTLKGKTTQNGTPTPSNPIEVETITGLQQITASNKNLFNTNNKTTTWKTIIEEESSNNVTLKPTENVNAFVSYRISNIQSSTQYTFSCAINIVNSVKNWKGQIYIREYNASGTQHYITNISTDNLKRTFATQNDTTELGFDIYSCTGSETNYENMKAIYTNLQLEKGNTATDYIEHEKIVNEINLGKNLLDYSTLQDGYVTTTGTINTTHSKDEMYSNFIKVKPNTTYTFSIQETSSNYAQWFGIGMYSSNNESSFIRRDGGEVSTKTYTFTTTSATQYIRASARNLKQATKVQLEKGSVATEYSKYFTPIKLCNIGNYQDKIYRTSGKNIFDMTTAVQSSYGYHSNTGTLTHIDTNTIKIVKGITSSNHRSTIANNVSISSGTTINISWKYASGNGNVIAQIQALDKDNNIINLTSLNNNGLTSPQQITLSTDITYIWLGTAWNNNSDLVISNIMINKGTTATEYEPYGSGKWYLQKNIDKIIINENSTLSVPEIIPANNKFIWRYTTALNMAGSGARANILSNYYIGDTGVYGANDKIGVYVNGSGITNFATLLSTIGATTSSTTTQALQLLKTWLSNNNVIFYYPLATPTHIEITNTELINQLENIRLLNGYNYIVSSLPIEIDYYDDNGEVLKDYSDLNDKRDTQPITSVSIGSSQIQGQEAILRDTELIEEYGEHWLTINDNPFAYTLEKRQQLVTAIFNKVKGFGYSSFTSKYTYRPYLSLGDKIKFKNKAGQLIDSIILRYNMDYDDCTFEAPSITSSTINYELSPSPEETAKRAEIIANQAEAKITSVVSKVDEVEVTVYGEYELTKDTTYQEDKTYYVFDGTDYIEFTDFEVGDTIPANTIYERDETSSLEQRMQQAEFTLHEQGAVLEIKTSKIDDDGNTTSFKTTNYTLDENGFEIDDGSGYKSLSTTTGQYYYDNDVMVGKYTKDIAVHKDLALYGKYYYGIDESVDVENFSKDDAMFMAQMYEAQWEDENGTTQTEKGLGHFYNMD